MSTMSEWIGAVCAELGLELTDQEATTTAVLDLTAEVAHGVARPAAPVTAFLIGLAAGRAAGPGVDVDAEVAVLARRLGERAKRWGTEAGG
jgi:hypothetical protein